MDGLAGVYDRYAQPLYSYCSWLMPDPGAVAEAMIRTFLVVASTPGDRADSSRLRPWLYAVARRECRRLLIASGRWGESGAVSAADQGMASASVTSAAVEGDDGRGPEYAVLRGLIRATLAGLDPRAG